MGDTQSFDYMGSLYTPWNAWVLELKVPDGTPLTKDLLHSFLGLHCTSQVCVTWVAGETSTRDKLCCISVDRRALPGGVQYPNIKHGFSKSGKDMEKTGASILKKPIPANITAQQGMER